MMVRFTDKRGESGFITESLTVEYSGMWESQVREVVQEATEEIPNDDLYDSADLQTYLVMKLPEEAPILEVRRKGMR